MVALVVGEPSAAVRAYATGCRKGASADACTRLESLFTQFDTGQVSPPSYRDAVETACEAGSLSGCRRLGLVHKSEGKFDEAAAVFERACKEGEADACSNLGNAHAKGQGRKEDLPMAVSLHRKACDGGSLFGCHNLGGMYFDGRGVKVDLQEAARLYAGGCQKGYMLSCRNLGLMTLDGAGVEHSDARAAALLRTACDGGDGEACCTLASLYSQKRIAPPSVAEATRVQARGCELGVEPCCPQ